MAIRVGDKVIFGRTHGEKTRGTVTHVSRSTVVVRQDESRGAMRSHPVGTNWRVPMSMVEVVTPTKAPGAKKAGRRSLLDRPRDHIEIGNGLLWVGPSQKRRGKYRAALWTPKHQTGDIEIELDSTGLHDATIEALEVLHGAAEIFLYGDLEDFAPSISEKHARSKFVKQTAEWAYNNAAAIERLLNAQ